jgi:hypothetical protein
LLSLVTSLVVSSLTCQQRKHSREHSLLRLPGLGGNMGALRVIRPTPTLRWGTGKLASLAAAA